MEIFVIKSGDEEFISSLPAGVHADSIGNLMCRINQPLYYAQSKDAVVVGAPAVIVAPFIQMEFDEKSFLILAESGYFTSIYKDSAEAIIKLLEKQSNAGL